MLTKLLEEELTELVERLFTNVLHEEVVQCKINNLTIKEKQNETQVNFVLRLGAQEYSIEGIGVGFVDATVTSIFNAIKHEYSSLFDFYFSDFYIKADFGSRANKVRTNVPVKVKLCISNSRENKFYFEGTDVSLISAVTITVEKMLNFLINCEKAVKCLSIATADAKRRNRLDLVNDYVAALADLVKINDYSKLIKEEK